MPRRLRIDGLLIACLVMAFSSVGIARGDNTDVSMFRGNAAHTGEMAGPGPGDDPVERWHITTPAAVSSSPAVVDDVVFVGSQDGNVYAFDAASGREHWRFATNDRVWSSPAVADGVVYIGSLDGNVYALDASSGTELWRFTTGFWVSSSPAVVEGVVYIGSLDKNVYALDALSGSELWRFTTGNWVSSSPAVADGVVYVGSDDKNVYALDAETGRERWRFATRDVVSSSPAVTAGTVFVGSFDRNVYALDATNGRERWHFATGDSVFSSPAVIDGSLYFGSADGSVYALDAGSGSERWRFATQDKVWSSPAVAYGVVYVGSNHKTVHALDAEGGIELWRFTTGQAVTSSPAVVDGTVYVGSWDGVFYAIGSSTDELIATPVADQTAEAIDKATAEAQRAEDQIWEDYFASVANQLRSSDELPVGSFIGEWQVQAEQDGLPNGWTRGAFFPIDTLEVGDQLSIVLSIYDSRVAATASYEAVIERLQRAGRQPQDVVGIDHDHTCLSAVRDRAASAVCYIARDKTIMTISSYLPVDSGDGVVMNAVVLAVIANDVYNVVEPPS